MNAAVTCPFCGSGFATGRGLKVHFEYSNYCLLQAQVSKKGCITTSQPNNIQNDSFNKPATNDTEIFMGNDKPQQCYTHPQLPPGWVIKVLSTDRRFLFFHPNVGNTLTPPVPSLLSISAKELRPVSSDDGIKDNQVLQSSSSSSTIAPKKRSHEALSKTHTIISEDFIRLDRDTILHKTVEGPEVKTNEVGFKESAQSFEEASSVEENILSIDNNNDTVRVESTLMTQQQRNDLLPDVPVSIEDRAQVSLLSILKDIGAPLNAYSKIMDWAAECHNDGYRFPINYPSRENVLQRMFDEFDLNGIKPKIVTLTLENGGKAEVAVFDFLQMVRSLLSDPELMKDENLVFENDALERPPKKARIGEVNTGRWHRKAYKNLCRDPLDLLCSLTLFIDKTHTALLGKLNLEPVSFTLNIFKREIRNQAKAWRPLGYVTDLHVKSRKVRGREEPERFGMSMRDYHCIMSAILESLINVQKSGGFRWNLTYRGVTKQVNFKVPIALINGDTQGQDKLCGKYGSYNEGVTRICRYCDCPFDDADNPDYVFRHTLQKDIEELHKAGDKKGLEAISYHNVQNSFWPACFGGDPRGVHGACLAEILHMVQKGHHHYAKKGFFEVFSDGQKLAADRIFVALSDALKHHSDRSLPSSYFPYGITSLKKINAHEESGVILLIVLLLCCNKGRDVISKIMSEGRRGRYLHLFEFLLCFEEWLKQETYDKDILKERARNKIKEMMKIYIRTVKRRKGNGLKIPKVHLAVHIIDDMLRKGSPLNSDSGPGETAHKVMAKQPGKNTQRHVNTFEIQSARRYVENLVIDRAANAYLPELIAPNIPSDDYIGGNKFIIHCTRRPTRGYDITSSNDDIIGLYSAELLRFIAKHISNLAIENAIECFTEHKRNDITFRAHPNYRGNKWHDWAMFQWDEDVLIPGEIKLFVNLTDIEEGAETHVNGCHVTEPGIYAVVRSLVRECDQNVSASKLIFKGKKQNITKKNKAGKVIETERPAFVLINVDCIADSAVVVPNLGGNGRDVLFITSRTRWASMFMSM